MKEQSLEFSIELVASQNQSFRTKIKENLLFTQSLQHTRGKANEEIVKFFQRISEFIFRC